MSTSQQAAQRLMAWLNKHMSSLKSQEALDQFFESKWDRAIKQSCEKYNVERSELFSALIDLL